MGCVPRNGCCWSHPPGISSAATSWEQRASADLRPTWVRLLNRPTQTGSWATTRGPGAGSRYHALPARRRGGAAEAGPLGSNSVRSGPRERHPPPSAARHGPGRSLPVRRDLHERHDPWGRGASPARDRALVRIRSSQSGRARCGPAHSEPARRPRRRRARGRPAGTAPGLRRSAAPPLPQGPVRLGGVGSPAAVMAPAFGHRLAAVAISFGALQRSFVPTAAASGTTFAAGCSHPCG